MKDLPIVPGTISSLFGGSTSSGKATRELGARLEGDPRGPFLVENLAGVMTVVPDDVDEVVVDATVRAESAELAGAVSIVQVADKHGQPTLRVRYPLEVSRSFRYTMSGVCTTEYDGSTVTVSGTSGPFLCADVRVRVPKAAIVAAFVNPVGELNAEGLEGRIILSSMNGNVTARSLSGELRADTGSGGVVIEGLTGSVTSQVGSASCSILSCSGEAIICGSGSGAITIGDARAEKIEVRTGSGAVRIVRPDVDDIIVQTGSGGILLDGAGGRVRRVRLQSGSGSAALRIPDELSFRLRAVRRSGRLSGRLPNVEQIARGRGVSELRRGDGRVSIEVATGSGNIVITAAS